MPLTASCESFYYFPLMTRRLPEEIDPYRLARFGETLRGGLAIARMRRLADMLYRRDGEVEIELRFEQTESGQVYVRGAIVGTLELVCQRCLEGMPFDLDIKVNLALVGSNRGARTLNAGHDPLVVSDGSLLLTEMVEDELILALPLVANHDPEKCVVDQRYRANASQGSEAAINPFQILAQRRAGKR